MNVGSLLLTAGAAVVGATIATLLVLRITSVIVLMTVGLNLMGGRG
jgi:hypothetical protein